MATRSEAVHGWPGLAKQEPKCSHASSSLAWPRSQAPTCSAQAEEERLVDGQRRDGTNECRSGGKARRRRGGKGGGADAAPLPVQNGEGDRLSVSSGIVQARLPPPMPCAAGPKDLRRYKEGREVSYVMYTRITDTNILRVSHVYPKP